jgi:pimeloyl-ACP methyl ester carboxylesterase
MPTAMVGDISIHYEVHGEGEPLLLIMGYGANSSWWYQQIVSFSQEYRVIVFDNRGSGLSDKPDTPYTIPLLADDAAGLLDALDIEAAHVFGVSMGGMIAQELVLRHPDRATSLILGCTTPGGRNTVLPDQESLDFLFDHEHRQQLSSEQHARELLPFLFSQGFLQRNSHRVEEFVSRAFEHATPIHGYRRQGEAIMQFNVYDRLPRGRARPSCSSTSTTGSHRSRSLLS